MMEKTNEKGFNVLIGATRQQVVNYLGNPDMDTCSLMMFQRNKNFLILKFRKERSEMDSNETVQGYIVISPENLVQANGMSLISKNDAEKIKESKSVSSVLKEYGDRYEACGSTFDRPVFFTDYGTILVLITEEDTISQAKEFTLARFLQKEDC